MLVLTRRESEEVLIGDPASPIGVVTVERIQGDRVRLGFTFPKEIPVHRREVTEQINAGIIKEKAHADHGTSEAAEAATTGIVGRGGSGGGEQVEDPAPALPGKAGAD